MANFEFIAFIALYLLALWGVRCFAIRCNKKANAQWEQDHQEYVELESEVRGFIKLYQTERKGKIQ